MKKLYVFLIIMIVMGISATTILAQDDLTQTFTAPDGSYSLMYPANWSAALDARGVYVIISSQDKSVVGNITFDSQQHSAKELVTGFTKGSNVTDTNITVTEFEVNGLKAARSQFKAGTHTEEVIAVEFPNGKSLRIAVYEDTPDAVANAGATLVAIAKSFQVGIAAAPAPGEAAKLTQTFTASDGSYSFMYPFGWSWIADGPHDASLYQSTDAGTLAGTISVVPLATGATLQDVLRTLLGNVDVTIIQVNGRDIARVQKAGVGTAGTAFAVALHSQVVIGIFTASDVVLKNEEATLLATMASVTASGAPAANATPSVSPTSAGDQATATSTPQASHVVNGISEIVFPGADRGYSNLFVINRADQKVTQLTHEQLNTLLPAWSPDGTMIAYITDTSSTAVEALDVFIVPSSGGKSRKVSSVSSTTRGAIAWSPDSKQLMFLATRDETSGAQIYQVNADGSNEHKLMIDAKAINSFTLDWSPDGKHIALVAFPNGGPDYALLLANPDGSNLTPVPNVKIVQVGEFFKWSPDGQHAVISDTKSLTVTNADGSAPQVIIDPSANLQIGGVSWSPDSTQIAFSAVSGSETALSLFEINADGSNQQKIDLGGHEVIWGGISWGVLPTSASSATPATASTVASGTASASACVVTAASAVNLRSGPGTAFAKAGSLDAGKSADVDGQAQGSDGKTWYRTTAGTWVRSDLVTSSGDCASVPTVTP